MGATVIGNTIYVSTELVDRLNKREYKVVLAHEVGHWKQKHRILLLPVVLLFWWCPAVVNAFKRFLERQADIYALKMTKDIDAFITLLDKLQHDNATHPTKEARIQLAQAMRGRL